MYNAVYNVLTNSSLPKLRSNNQKVETYIKFDMYVGIQQQALHKPHQGKKQREVIQAARNLPAQSPNNKV